jgi:hypothetical protein
MFMIRDPYGTASPKINWNSDSYAWTSDYLSQVPLSVDPIISNKEYGIFFVEHTDF